MRVGIVYIGMSNTASVCRALEDAGASPFVMHEPCELSQAQKIILPGVGSFNQAMNSLKKMGWVDALQEHVLGQKKPLLGICLGMQLLLQQGCEGGDSAGLGYIEGAVQHLQNLGCQARLPHMGWNSVAYAQPHHLFAGVASESDWYFVHSYAVQTAHTESIIGQTEHDIVFTSVIAKDNVMGVQFHPEKSGKQGRKLLENFVVL